MFTAFRKSVGGRSHNRYFHDWDNAKAAMEKDIKDMVGAKLAIVTKRYDHFNHAKGFYVYEANGLSHKGEAISWALIDSYFEDETGD